MVLRKVSPITKGRKFKQVLEGARKVFLREGYAGASVDDIAGEAKVSKATLYSYFPDKEQMFSEVFRADLVQEDEEPLFPVSSDLPAARALPQIVEVMVARIVSPAGLHAYRMRVGESARFPELAREYHDAVHRRQRDALRQVLERWVRRGELEIVDTELAAEQLIALAAALIRDRALFLGSDSVTDLHLRRITDGAVQVFLSAYTPQFESSHGLSRGARSYPGDRSKTVPPME
ncbi:TetR/AcrR family transcriptional regulator [uncultured Paracoccus sp.]|uniref:TetR/AcrR family transcriptional regulator n=1 Tax=uncultured Paracoccus sp. TaxID=189685 RepID=UPI00261D64E2|nr:TetR/AcrR family transcriptional regulator [uncultured Paracoccus sp.]